jgi:hypothetical protein
MGLSDSRPGPIPRLCIPSGRLGSDCTPPPCRVSQIPRLIYSCALSPTTPEGPTGACSLLPRRYQASSSLADWPPSISVTRPNRVRLRYGSQVCFPGFHQTDYSAPLRFSYMYERAIYMVNSFQFTRSARLILVFLRRRDRRREHHKSVFSAWPRRLRVSASKIRVNIFDYFAMKASRSMYAPCEWGCFSPVARSTTKWRPGARQQNCVRACHWTFGE